MKRTREIESLQSKSRRVVFEFGAVATLRQLVGIGNRWLEQVIRGVLDVAGNLTRPRLERFPPRLPGAGAYYTMNANKQLVLVWGSRPYLYSGGRASRLPYANPP